MWKNECFTGCFPILFSILSNIYLHELDLCVKDWIKANSVESIKGISKVNRKTLNIVAN